MLQVFCLFVCFVLFCFLGAEGAQRLAASNFYFVDGEIRSSRGSVILGYLTNQSASTFMNSAMPAAKDHHSLLTTDGRGGEGHGIFTQISSQLSQPIVINFNLHVFLGID